MDLNDVTTRLLDITLLKHHQKCLYCMLKHKWIITHKKDAPSLIFIYSLYNKFATKDEEVCFDWYYLHLGWLLFVIIIRTTWNYFCHYCDAADERLTKYIYISPSWYDGLGQNIDIIFKSP